MAEVENSGAWDEDRLGFKAKGETFTALVQTIEDAKVISIEAPFGRGKTFFRKAWAKHLADAGEVVVEIDAQQSDHSGDPVVTFLGALLAKVPADKTERRKSFFKAAKTVAAAGAKAATGAVLRQGADHIFELFKDEDGNLDLGEKALKDITDDLGKGLSDYLGTLIADQLRAEAARKELPEQLDNLRRAITADAETDRVVILIDELDRCHPDYSIALLEAMKLAFNQRGFVFVLMVNRDHLETIAAHRFGDAENGERYLDKFIDMPLSLGYSDEVMAEAARSLTRELPEPAIPFGEGAEFTVERAAKVAGDLAPESGLSMRQIERVLLRVHLALATYREKPIDVALLVALAFQESVVGQLRRSDSNLVLHEWGPALNNLRRLHLSPHRAAELENGDAAFNSSASMPQRLNQFLAENCASLNNLPAVRYRLDPPPPGHRWTESHKLLAGLAPYYVPEHQAMLDSVQPLVASDRE